MIVVPTAALGRQAPHHARLLRGMADAVTTKGYPAVTIADIVAAAGVSKRTFYEHFTSKLDCLLACYAEAADQLIGAVRQSAAAIPAGPARVTAGIDAYLGALDQTPEWTTALLLEIDAAGAAGRTLRRRKNLEFAGLIRDLATDDQAPGARLDLDLALAVVGGIAELVAMHVDQYPERPFRALGPSVRRFLGTVLGTPANA